MHAMSKKLVFLIECYIGSRYNVGRDTVVPGPRY